jgi:hypothetical protein
MMSSLVTMYRKGAITADHLVVECLQLIDPNDPAPVLEALPDEILDRMLDFAHSYRPNSMVTNFAVLPAVDQVKAARRWIESARNPVRTRSAPSEFSE